jgi:hypothetical protein
MAYRKHIWIAPEGTNLNRFIKANETDESVDLIQNPSFTNIPTPFSAEWMNDIEEGIESSDGQFAILNSQAEEMDGHGRNILEVLGVSTIPAATAVLRALCNGTGKADFSLLRHGDYIDGINLSAIPAENGGDAGQVWNDTYKNNRIIISGFNTYKGYGDTEITKNHILFTFRNIPLRKRINATNTNTGGYQASEIRAFLEGVNGDGTGSMQGVTTAAFLDVLRTQLGGNYLLTIRKYHWNKGVNGWKSYTLFLPSELELFGYPTYGEEGVYGPTDRGGYNTNVHFKIYHSGEYRIKKYNGARTTNWTQTPTAANAADFARCTDSGNASSYNASSVYGCAPAFCVA